MASQSDFTKSFAVNAAMSAYRLVAISTNGSIGLNAINGAPVGIIQRDVTAGAYETASVRLFGTGSAMVCVTGAVTVGDTLYAVTNGMVAVTNLATGGQKVGIALDTTVTVAGAIIEMIPQVV